jgi:hypothetical protein
MKAVTELPIGHFSPTTCITVGRRDLAAKLRVEWADVHVAFGRPCGSGDVPQPRCSQIETGLTVRKCANDTMDRASL